MTHLRKKCVLPLRTIIITRNVGNKIPKIKNNGEKSYAIIKRYRINNLKGFVRMGIETRCPFLYAM